MEMKCINCGKPISIDSSVKGYSDKGREYLEVKCGNCKKRFRCFMKRD